MEEIWKDLEGYEEYYEISNLGKVRSKPKILKHRINNRGYHMIELYDRNGNKFTALIHRLVAQTFLEVPEELENVSNIQVNHKNGNKNDNTLENLEWCDQSHNMKEAYRLGLRKYVPYKITDEYRYKLSKIHKGQPAPGKEVQMIDKETKQVIETFESSVDAVRKHPELNLKDSSIRDAANERRGIKSYKGFIWKFTGKITNGTKCRKFNPENKTKKIKR